MHEFNEVVFEDAFMPDAHLLGEIDGAWKQATSELAFQDHYLRHVKATHPLLRFVGFDAVQVAQALEIPTPPWAISLVDASRSSLVWAGESEGQRTIWIGFDGYAIGGLAVGEALGRLIYGNSASAIEFRELGELGGIGGTNRREGRGRRRYRSSVPPDAFIVTRDVLRQRAGPIFFRPGPYRPRSVRRGGRSRGRRRPSGRPGRACP